ncbi:MAG TPA: hypothetical protein VNT75_06240 [Symbiobacteriaceae bacterium]|nr:hypothetical protein [Symbiobacteriaceae bacterium]
MKKIRGIVVLAVVLAALALATVVQAGGATTMGVCYYDAKGNIVWCSE